MHRYKPTTEWMQLDVLWSKVQRVYLWKYRKLTAYVVITKIDKHSYYVDRHRWWYLKKILKLIVDVDLVYKWERQECVSGTVCIIFNKEIYTVSTFCEVYNQFGNQPGKTFLPFFSINIYAYFKVQGQQSFCVTLIFFCWKKKSKS